MTAKTRRATVLLCSVAVAALATSAFARPVHHHHYRNHAVATTQTALQPQLNGADRDARYSFNGTQTAMAVDGDTVVRGRRHGRGSLANARAQAQSHSNSAYGG